LAGLVAEARPVAGAPASASSRAGVRRVSLIGERPRTDEVAGRDLRYGYRADPIFRWQLEETALALVEPLVRWQPRERRRAVPFVAATRRLAPLAAGSPLPAFPDSRPSHSGSAP